MFDHKYSFQTSNCRTVELEHVKAMKDLGVIIDSELSFKEHIYEKIKKAYQMIGISNRNFKDLDVFSFLLLYKSLVRSQMEYANVVWNPHSIQLMTDIEIVQKRAIKLVKGLGKLSYRDRLFR